MAADTPIPGHRLRATSLLLDGEGNEKLRWIKADAHPSVTDIIQECKAALAGYKPPKGLIKPPQDTQEDTLTLYPVSDMHIGLRSWHRETGVDWDLNIAETAICAAFERLVVASPPSSIAVVLGGGDQMHSNNNENVTPRSKHILQVDGRYHKVLEYTCRMFVRMVYTALLKHQTVIVRTLGGNHDPEASIALALYLHAYFRLDSRVTVDTDASMYWWYRHGKTFLGATHGHAAKPAQMPAIMASRRAKDWGASEHRFIHMFHLHHAAKAVTEGGGCVVETHQAPVAQDAWAFGAGFLSQRSLSAITYSKKYGEIARSRVVVQ